MVIPLLGQQGDFYYLVSSYLESAFFRCNWEKSESVMKGNIPAEFHEIRAEIINHRVWGTPANALIITLPEYVRIATRTLPECRQLVNAVKEMKEW